MQHPLDADLSFTGTDSSVEFYWGPTRVYQNLTDIAAWVAGTDPAAAEDGNNSVLFKLQCGFSWTSPTTYTITDNTSLGCITAHEGYKVHHRALNGDTYTFDTTAGMPMIVPSFSVLSTTRRAGNDVTGVDDDGHSYENNFWKDPEAELDDVPTGSWTTRASVDNNGAVGFMSAYYPDSLAVPGTTVIGPHSVATVRWKYKTVAKDFTSDSSTITNIVKGFPSISIAPRGISSTGALTTTQGMQTISSDDPQPNVCQGDVAVSADIPSEDYDFDIDARSSAAGSYLHYFPSRPYFTAAEYQVQPGTSSANWATDITTTATVGTRSNPGGQNCSRCYTVEFTVTDGDTAAVTTLFSGEVFQAMGGRVGPGVDPRTLEGWVSTTSWSSRGVYPSLTVTRRGPELWVAFIQNTAGGPTSTYNLKGADCLEEIEEAEAFVSEVMFWTTTGAGTVSDPTIRGGSTRLKIDTCSFVATPSTCSECLDDPCEEPCDPPPDEVVLWNTGEEVIAELDQHWQIETAEGSGSFTPAWSYPPYPLHVTPGPDATWIGLEDGVAFPSAEIRLFRTEIEITGTPADITGVLNSDTSVVSINVNGTMVDGSIATNPYSFTLPAAELIVGTNVILFEVYGDGIVTDGLLVEWD